MTFVQACFGMFRRVLPCVQMVQKHGQPLQPIKHVKSQWTKHAKANSKNMIFGTQQLDRMWSWMKKFIPPQSSTRSKGLVPGCGIELTSGSTTAKSGNLESRRKDTSTLYLGTSQHKICISCGRGPKTT